MKEISSNPTAKVAVNKNVLKIYKVDNTNYVYLKDESNFELELYNPTNSTILAKISINGECYNDGGLVLRPGQRVFLERFLDSTNKFKFNTYNVDNGKQTKEAIKDNGLIRVDFYYEVHWKDFVYYTLAQPIKSTPDLFYNSVSPILGNKTSVYGDSVCFSGVDSGELAIASIETGRIEKGEHSNQKFTDYTGNFADYAFSSEIIKIMPYSTKPIEASDIIKVRKYCHECGSKVGTNDKYCSECGTKL